MGRVHAAILGAVPDEVAENADLGQVDSAMDRVLNSKLLQFAGATLVLLTKTISNWIKKMLAGGTPHVENASSSPFIDEVKVRLGRCCHIESAADSGKATRKFGKDAVTTLFANLQAKHASGGDVEVPRVKQLTQFMWLLDAEERTKCTKFINKLKSQGATGCQVAEQTKKKMKTLQCEAASAKAMVAGLFKK